MILKPVKDRQRTQLLNTVEYLIDRHAKNSFFYLTPNSSPNWSYGVDTNKMG